MQIRKAALCLFFVFGLAATTASACPNCKNAKVDSDDPQATLRLKDGYFWSYIAMTSMPFVSIGGIVSMLVYSSKKKQQR